MRTFSLVDIDSCSCIVLFQKIPHSHELCKMDDMVSKQNQRALLRDSIEKLLMVSQLRNADFLIS